MTVLLTTSGGQCL